MLEEPPVAFVRKDHVEDDHLRIVLRQHGPDVESLAYVGDVDDQDDEPRLFNLHLEKFNEIGVCIDDGDNRLRWHTSQTCIAHTARLSVDGIVYLRPDEMAGILTYEMVMDEHATVLRKNIRAIADLEQRALHQRSAADRLSDAISRRTGSGPFALSHVIGFSLWVLINIGIVPGIEPFDPYPFNFLTLVVSLEAIFLSVFVLMSQNRMTRQAEKRAHLDLQVDMLAEQELTAILRMVQGLCEKQGVEVLARDDRLEELVKETDVHTVAAALEDRLPDS